MIDGNVLIKEIIKSAEIQEKIDQICKQYTPYNHPIHYNLLRTQLVNGCMNLIQWNSALGCSYIDHTTKIKEVLKNDN